MLKLNDFAQLDPNAREQLIQENDLHRSGFGADVRGNEIFMFDGFTQIDLINVNINANEKNTQQDVGGSSEGIATISESVPAKRGRKAKAVSVSPSK